MGKHSKSKPISGKSPQVARRDAARPVPYPKKPRVDVRYEGASQIGKTHVPKGDIPSASTQKKGKGKAIDESAPTTLSATSSAQAAASSFIIIAGSYEKLLYGLEGSYECGSVNPTLKPIFIFPAHLACVKAVAASPGGKWLATGSEDEFVKVWDLRRRKEVGSLSQHEGMCPPTEFRDAYVATLFSVGSITSLHFPTSSHLLTTSVDATISLFRTSDWALLKSLKGHSGRVNHVDVHPTGRVALSVGKDRTLKMWDLMRGRGAASLALGNGQPTPNSLRSSLRIHCSSRSRASPILAPWYSFCRALCEADPDLQSHPQTLAYARHDLTLQYPSVRISPCIVVIRCRSEGYGGVVCRNGEGRGGGVPNE